MHGGCDSCQRVQNVVPPVNRQLNPAQKFIAVENFKRHAVDAGADIFRREVGVVIDGVGNNFAVEFFSDFAQIFAVVAEHGNAGFFVEIFQKNFKRRANFFNGAVVVEVVVFDIRDNGDSGLELDKRAVAFVRFGNDVFALAEDGAGAEVSGFAANDNRGVDAGFVQHETNHGRGGSFAVGARDGDTFSGVDEHGVNVGAVELRNFEFSRFENFGVIVRNGGRNYQRFNSVGDIIRTVPDKNFRAEIFKHLNSRRISAV